MSKPKMTSIGGQALIEGVMMRGPYKTSMAVRDPQGEIVIEEVKYGTWGAKSKFLRLPLIRGVINLVDSMRVGMKCLMRSADISLGEETEEEEKSKFEKKMDQIFGEKLVGILMGIASVLGVALAIFLFMFLPSLLFNWFKLLFQQDIENYRALFEGILKIGIFLTYLKLVSQMKEIHRVFEYHGAEHKTIFCYEAGEELTVENVKKYKRFHPRCGTSFMFLMILIGIILGFLLTMFTDTSRNLYLWVTIKILMIPVLCAIGYELIKFVGRHGDSKIGKIISTPGLWVQRLTTYEPDDSQIETAIAAMNEVIPENEEDDIW